MSCSFSRVLCSGQSWLCTQPLSSSQPRASPAWSSAFFFRRPVGSQVRAGLLAQETPGGAREVPARKGGGGRPGTGALSPSGRWGLRCCWTLEGPAWP